MEINKQLLIGLPESGKTTFLAALWHVVQYGEVANSLQLDQLIGEREYLNNIKKKWLNCVEMGRTVTPLEKRPSMILKEPNRKNVTQIFFPDMSGEDFSSQWEDRKWTKSYFDLVKDMTGVLLFVHPEKINKGALIPEDKDLSKNEHSTGTDKDLADTSCDVVKDWKPSRASTQAILVDILQFILWKTRTAKIKISVIISAWDIVEENNKQCKNKLCPDQWLEERLPLLDQYLKANFEVFKKRIYGVSAQGGELQKEVIKKLQSMGNQAERIKVISSNLPASHDITDPIRWLMD